MSRVTKTKRARLADAAAILEDVARDLNTRETVCGCCAAPRRENFTEYLMHEQVSAMVRKLRAFIKDEGLTP